MSELPSSEEPTSSPTEAAALYSREVASAFCAFGLIVFGISLFLPASRWFRPLLGFECLFFGFYWWPSNLALVVSPLVCARKGFGLCLTLLLIVGFTAIGNFFLCLYSTDALIGAWVWMSSYFLMATGLAIRVKMFWDQR